MNNYQEYIHLSRYARWNEENGRRETWEETVERYVKFFENKFGNEFPRNRIKDAIVNMKVMPSMRALMTAGKALDRDHVAGYNCLAGETLVTTKEYGIIEISKLAGKKVHIVDGNGNWTLSECKSYGKQPLMKVNFGTSGKGQFSIYATPEHRWIDKKGDVVFTKDLKQNHKLATVSMPEFNLRDDNNFKQIDIKKNPGFGLVKSIESTDRFEEVFCFEVPTTQSFLLTENLLTGNCSFLAIDHPRSFDECMFILMCGTGVGFSVERQFVSKLPTIPEEFNHTETTIVVADSKIGWSTAYKELINLLYAGAIPKWDTSKIRPSGSRLKTFGGRASGPKPLEDLFKFTINVFKDAAGRKLTSIECHDIICKIADIVVVGGVRRCLPDDTLVQISPDDWKKISEFVPGDSIYIDGEYHKVNNIFDQGVQDVIRIDLDDGKYIESTPNHKWLVFNSTTNQIEWVMAKDLGDNHAFIDPT